jgi:hypothetical protein
MPLGDVPAENELTASGDDPPAPLLIANCQIKSPVTVGVRLPAEIVAEDPELQPLQWEVSTAVTL